MRRLLGRVSSNSTKPRGRQGNKMRAVMVQVSDVVDAKIYVGRLVCMVFAKVSFGWEEGVSVELRGIGTSCHSTFRPFGADI